MRPSRRHLGLIAACSTLLLAAGGRAEDSPSDKPAAPAKFKITNYKTGEKLEVKWGGMWRACTVVNRRGDWFLISYDGWSDAREWAEPWRLRPVGSKYDVDAHITNPRLSSKKMADPPRPTPGEPPSKDAPADTAARPSPFAPPDAGIAIKEPQRDGRRIAPASESWAFKPAAGPKLSPPGPTLLPPLGDFFSSYSDLAISGNLACVSIRGDRPGENAKTGLVKVNLAAATALGVETPGASLPLGLSPNGQVLVARSNGFHSKTNGRIDLYKVVDRKTVPITSFFPAEDKADVSHAFFIDDTHLITLAGDVLASWDTESLACQWQFDATGKTLARSPDGKVAAVHSTDGLALIDLAEGKCVGVLDGDRGGPLSFSTDGARLLALSGNIVTVWDTAAGKQLFTLGLPPGVGSDLVALDADHALIGTYLFSLSKKRPVWNYAGGSHTTTAGGRVFTLITGAGRGDKNLSVASAVLPHPAAAAAIKNLADAPMVLQPGMKVSIDFQHEADEQHKQNAITKLTRTLNAADIEVVPGQPVVIQTRTEAGKSETREYEKRQGFDRERENITINSKITTLSIVYKGKAAWSISNTFRTDPGYMVQLKKGESVQGKADAFTVNNDWIGDAALPTYVAAPTNLETLPTSHWAVGGVKDK